MPRDYNPVDLDNYITGHWGEDQYEGYPETEYEKENRKAREKARKARAKDQGAAEDHPAPDTNDSEPE